MTQNHEGFDLSDENAATVAHAIPQASNPVLQQFNNINNKRLPNISYI